MKKKDLSRSLKYLNAAMHASSHSQTHAGGNGKMLSRWEKRTYVPKWVVQKGFKKCVMGQELI